MRQYDVAVIIGRFQPFHNGHRYLIERAMLLADKVVVLVGSANKAPNIKNPFTFAERKAMIEGVFVEECNAGLQTTAALNACKVNRLVVRPLKDFMYNDERWVQGVQAQVAEETSGTTGRVALVGHSKDESSYYLKLFPQWEYKDVGHADNLNSTDIRELLYDRKTVKYLQGVVPETVYKYISDKVNSGGMATLVEEHEFIEKYKKAWAAAPYAPTFWTADAVVIQQGHVLLVKRGAMPGKGLWALPGGFVNQNEFTRDAAIRELREETKLKVPDPVLRGSIVAEQVFDAPNRSLRGRTITQAFLIHLKNIEQGLPKVKGSDDAMHAQWVPLADLKEEEFFEDHYHIIQTLIGRL